jgi:hypothetical protein
MSTPITDDLDAVRAIVEAVKNFKTEEQQRIFRWAAEKLGLSIWPLHTHATTAHPLVGEGRTSQTTSTPGTSMNIKTFIAEKRPRSDVQYAAAVAFYYRFEAPEAEKKDFINSDELQESTRKAGRERFGNPLQTLNNAHKLGLLDRGPERGTFLINSVGENLVAMTLPDGEPVKKTAKKKAAKKAKKA